MIDIALAHIAGQLDQALRRSFGVTESLVAVSNLVDLGGSVAPQVADKLVVLLVDIEREALAWRESRPVTSGGRVVVASAPAHLNLSVLLAGNFGGANYAEALKLVSGAIAFFQARPVLDHANTPDLDERIDKLTLEIANLDIAARANLWGMLGGKYLPSVLYKVRMVTVDAHAVVGQVTPVRNTQVEARP